MKFDYMSPNLMQKCVFYDLSTPLSAKFFVEADQGAIYGLDASVERFQNPSLYPDSPIKNFYLTGVDTTTPGVVGAMMSGVLTAAATDKKVFLSVLRFLRGRQI